MIRAVALGATVLWIGTAEAGKKGKSDPDTAALAAQEAEACAQEKVEGFQIRTGYATRPDPAEAIQVARREARRDAISSLCLNKSQARCAVIRRHLEDWQQPFYNPVTQRACAHVGVNRKWINDDKGDQEALGRDLADLAAQIRGQSQLLILQPTLWAETGCSAGDLGATLLNELKNQLADGTTRITSQGAPGAAALQLILHRSGDDITLAASLRAPQQSADLPLKGFAFAADLFQVDAGQGDCRFDRDLGLVDGRRDGSAGAVSIDIGQTGVFCEGDKVEPVVRVERASVVKVYSIARDGQAYLIWPPSGQDGVIEQSIELGSMDLLINDARGDEKMVAVAMPVGTSYGATEGWTGFCEVPNPFSAGSYPESASAAAASFRVLPLDDTVCLSRQVGPQQAPTLPPIPTCPDAL